MKDKFFDIKRTKVNTKVGSFELPIFYYDSSTVIAIFWVDKKKVSKLIEGTDYKPTVFFNNKAMVGIVFFEYRDTSIGAYNEVALTSFVYSKHEKKPFFLLPNFLKRGDKWNMGAYVHDLPVSTAIANAAGRKVWNLPKFITEMPFSLDKKRFEGIVKDPTDPKKKENILTLSGKIGPIGLGKKIKAFDIIPYAIKNGKQIKTVVTVDAKARVNLNTNIRLTIGNSKHKMAENLRTLGLDNKKPFMTLISDKSRSILPDGEPVVKKER